MAGEGVGKRNSYRVGAILYSGKQIIAAKHNSYQMSAKLIKYSNFPCRHAESNAILAHGMDNCEGLDMICTRVLKDGSLTMAEPCEACAELIKDVGLRRVYFTNWEGSVERFYF
jgi:tRNA(Arg) A34 adenosine deaminase TadA